MKNIIYYTDTPQIGGAEQIIYLLIKFLDKDLFRPILVCSNYKSLNKWAKKIEKEGAKIYRLNVKHKHDPRHYSQLKTILQQEKADLLHLHIWNPGSCRYAYLAGHKTKTPILITEHDPFKLSRIKSAIKSYNLSKTDHIIAISENNQKLLQDLFPKEKEKIKLIHNGIDLNQWKSQLMRFSKEDSHKIKKELFYANPNSLIILSVAELHLRKGQDILINCIPEIVKIYPNTKFVFAGNGEEKDNYIKQIKKLKIENNAILIGRRKNIAEIMASSDIFVLPSRREAFGLVNIEAMATALPVVAAKVGGTKEIIEDKRSGFLFEKENTTQLINILKQLIKDHDKRIQLGLNGYKRVKEKFDAKIMTKNYEQHYIELINKKNA